MEIAKIETKFDALKSHVTSEIFLANKLDSLLLVLHETLKTRDVRNSKLLLENFEFHRKEILSKDEFIKDLIETQSTVLSVVTSVKTQEKTEKIQRKSFATTGTTKSTKTTYTAFFT